MTIYKTLCIELLKEWDNAPTPSDIIDTDAYGVIRKIRTALETEETMTENHPITPPPELVQEWRNQAPTARDAGATRELWIATKAAQWAADRELDECCQQLRLQGFDMADDLCAIRRPKPLSLKQQALATLEVEPDDGKELLVFDTDQVNIIRRALEQLND